ncbi:ABC-three component system protein [Streptomyces sp900105755]|uniref:ABC-three component system protein n=1 Tax=Streptomyces sp. 900105755 TaxID=3154389 RepID=UPI003316524F
MARDPVPAAQAKIVIQRSGDCCAYPGCGAALTIDATVAEDDDKVVGKIAHIAAASKGGPRYDPSMTPKQRGSAANLIYLCGPHHDAIDTQLAAHTTEYLLDAKRAHERKVARAMSHAMGKVGFEHLEIVCKFLGTSTERTDDAIVIPIDIQEKIELNSLGPVAEERIQTGLAKSDEVGEFIESISSMRPNFGNLLAARFKQEYYGGIAQGLEGDDLFEYVCAVALDNAGPVESDTLRAAVLATVAHLFEMCEIFEHESSAA